MADREGYPNQKKDFPEMGEITKHKVEPKLEETTTVTFGHICSLSQQPNSPKGVYKCTECKATWKQINENTFMKTKK